MDKEQLSDAIGNIKDEHLAINNSIIKKNKSRMVRTVLSLAAVLALAVTAVIAIPKLLRTRPDTNITTTPAPSTSIQDEQQTQEPTTQPPAVVPLKYTVAEAVYPIITDDLWTWQTSKEDLMHYKKDDGKTDSPLFTRAILKEFLSGADKNAVFSPLGIYFSLASLAEIADGETRAQILHILNAPSIEALRKTARAVWLNVYVNGIPYESDNEKECVVPSNSFWLNTNAAVTGDASVAEILKNDYFTSFYKGDPLDEGFQNAYRTWMDEHTGGLLKDVVDQMQFSPEDVFSLVNTLFLKLTWQEPFNEDENTVEPFYGKKETSSTTFMHQTKYGGSYYKGSCFSSASLYTNSFGASVLFILPDSDTSLTELIDREAYMEILDYQGDPAALSPPEGYDMYEVHFSVPKFSITSSYDLKPYLSSLGVENAFDKEKADIPFIRSTDGSNIFITSAKQDVTVDVNEKGVSAASITTMDGGWGEPVFYEVEMNLNRPFLMLILSQCNTPLFAAVVNSME